MAPASSPVKDEKRCAFPAAWRRRISLNSDRVAKSKYELTRSWRTTRSGLHPSKPPRRLFSATARPIARSASACRRSGSSSGLRRRHRQIFNVAVQVAPEIRDNFAPALEGGIFNGGQVNLTVRGLHLRRRRQRAQHPDQRWHKHRCAHLHHSEAAPTLRLTRSLTNSAPSGTRVAAAPAAHPCVLRTPRWRGPLPGCRTPGRQHEQHHPAHGPGARSSRV